MPIFKYSGTDQTGAPSEGNFEAANEEQARSQLAQYGLTLTAIAQIDGGDSGSKAAKKSKDKKKKKHKKQKNKTKGHREGGTATGSLSHVLGGDGAPVFSPINSTTTATNESFVWSECRVRGTFSTSNADEDVRTNMYLLDVPPDTSEMIVQLHQRDRTCLGERDYVDIGLTVLSLSEDGNTYRMIPGGSTGCQLAREVGLACCCLLLVVCGMFLMLVA